MDERQLLGRPLILALLFMLCLVLVMLDMLS